MNELYAPPRTAAPFRPGTVLANTLLLMAFGLGLLGCGTFRYEHGGMVLGSHHYPGTMVDVGGHALYFNCTASAPHTVLLTPGGGGAALMAKPMQDLLAAEPGLQVCSYDRAGHGWSEPSEDPYDIMEGVESVHMALQKLNVSGRLILVGPSYGGFVIRAYADKYPEAVGGLVYVDPNSVAFFDNHPAIVAEMEAAKVPWYIRLMPDRLLRHVAYKRFRKELHGVDEAYVKALAHVMGSKKHLKGGAKYGRAFGTTLAYMRDIPNPPTLPTVLLTRGQRDTHDPWTIAAREQDWRDGQTTLLTGVEDGIQRIATESGHAINFDQPELVVEAVLNVVQRDRGRHQMASSP